MSGGCITISSLGSLGGKFFTPIINPPEVAILGISKFEIKPKLINNKFVARKILPISLSYDHRVIDGADAVRFTNFFADIISKPNLLIDGK
jgi:pyruvate dehydrogenase E2 component (dihydrolipoamide acetyltransferase)